ncbi:MAG: CrcB family protein [Nitriliruptoraceae bacterium]
MTLATWLAIAVAGAAGAVTRAALDTFAARRSLRARRTTATINVGGSVLAGLVAGTVVACGTVAAATVLATGFLGAFTTFSTAMNQIVLAASDGDRVGGAASAVATLGLAVAGAAAGWWLAFAFAAACR